MISQERRSELAARAQEMAGEDATLETALFVALDAADEELRKMQEQPSDDISDAAQEAPIISAVPSGLTHNLATGEPIAPARPDIDAIERNLPLLVYSADCQKPDGSPLDSMGCLLLRDVPALLAYCRHLEQGIAAIQHLIVAVASVAADIANTSTDDNEEKQ